MFTLILPFDEIRKIGKFLHKLWYNGTRWVHVYKHTSRGTYMRTVRNRKSNINHAKLISNLGKQLIDAVEEYELLSNKESHSPEKLYSIERGILDLFTKIDDSRAEILSDLGIRDRS